VDRLFLDANILFSAAYRPDAGLIRLWRMRGVTLCSSHYAVEEARINLGDEKQWERLRRLSERLELFDPAVQRLPVEIRLPEKDVPILLAAMEARASHLLTGDVRHFGVYFGKKISGIMVLPPGDYLKSHS